MKKDFDKMNLKEQADWLGWNHPVCRIEKLTWLMAALELVIGLGIIYLMCH